jgi:signal transduction histidine kinase/CheY-like chemotaxis protein
VILLSLNMAFAIQLWRAYRTPPYKTLVALWLCTTLSFLLQGIFSESVTGSLLAFPTYIMVVYYTCSLLAQVSSMPFNFKPFGLAFGTSLLISGGLYWQSDSFTLIALPVAIAIGAPQLVFALKKLLYYRHTGTQFSNSFAVLLLCNGLHFLDYPFLRPLPTMAIFGFGLVLVFTMGYAVLLPNILSKYHTDRSEADLLQEIKKRKQVEQELKLAVDKARHLADVKTEFLANMSHEIRTPLTGIMGLNDLLFTTKLSTEQQEYCDDISYASHTLRGIINNILSLSKLESGTTHVDHEPFSVKALSDEIDKHYSLNKPPNISIRYTVSETRLLGDKVKLQQVLFNLIDNAIKYSQGSIIDVFCTYDDSAALLTLKVADNGVGVSPAIKAQLFDRFEQLHQHGPVGVGLGLAIVKQLLTVMNGHISLDSEMDKGAVFTCQTPLLLATDAAEATTVPISTTTATPTPTTLTLDGSLADHGILTQVDDRQYYILVIDDDPITLNTLSVLLEQVGYRCYLAEDGTTAKQLLTHHNVDVILSDIQLPDVEGVELIRYFRAANQHIPIIAYSAFVFDEDVAAAIAAGASGYLRKPATFTELKTKLNACLNDIS